MWGCRVCPPSPHCPATKNQLHTDFTSLLFPGFWLSGDTELETYFTLLNKTSSAFLFQLIIRSWTSLNDKTVWFFIKDEHTVFIQHVHCNVVIHSVHYNDVICIGPSTSVGMATMKTLTFPRRLWFWLNNHWMNCHKIWCRHSRQGELKQPCWSF